MKGHEPKGKLSNKGKSKLLLAKGKGKLLLAKGKGKPPPSKGGEHQHGLLHWFSKGMGKDSSAKAMAVAA